MSRLKTKRLVASLGLFSLLLLLLASALFLWKMPHVSAIGCAPLDLRTEGPYQSSLQGVVSIGNETLGSSVKHVYTVEPGSSVNMTFGVVFSHISDYQVDRIVIPNFIFYPESPPDTRWLSVAYSPNPVVMKLFQEQANVTVTLNIAEDAPSGDYSVMLSTRIPGGGDCGYGGGAFILRIGADGQSTIINTVSTVSAIKSTVTVNAISTTTEISTKTVATTSITIQSTTFTNTVTAISTENVTNPSIYAWAVAATVVAAILAVVALRRKS